VARAGRTRPRTPARSTARRRATAGAGGVGGALDRGTIGVLVSEPPLRGPGHRADSKCFRRSAPAGHRGGPRWLGVWFPVDRGGRCRADLEAGALGARYRAAAGRMRPLASIRGAERRSHGPRAARRARATRPGPGSAYRRRRGRCRATSRCAGAPRGRAARSAGRRPTACRPRRSCGRRRSCQRVGDEPPAVVSRPRMTCGPEPSTRSAPSSTASGERARVAAVLAERGFAPERTACGPTPRPGVERTRRPRPRSPWPGRSRPPPAGSSIDGVHR
jgi:hypothetical protein